MNRSILSYGVCGAVMLFGFAACSSSSATGPGGADSTEVAADSRQGAGEGAASAIDQMNASEALYGAQTDVMHGAAVPADLTPLCTGPDDSGWYHCDKQRENGVDVTRSVRFWEGTSLGLWWNPGVTDSVNHQWTANGTITSQARPGRSLTVNDSAAGTMSVLRVPGGGSAIVTPLHRWEGTAAQHRLATYVLNNVERVVTHTGNDTVSALTFQTPRNQNPYPASGSITVNETVHFTAGNFNRTDVRRIVITFDGTHIATLTDGGVTCQLDLDTKVVSGCQ